VDSSPQAQRRSTIVEGGTVIWASIPPGHRYRATGAKAC